MMNKTPVFMVAAIIIMNSLPAFAGSIQEIRHPGWTRSAGDEISNTGEETRQETWTKSDGLNIGRHNKGYPSRDLRTCTVCDGEEKSGFNRVANIFRYGKCGDHSVKVYEETRSRRKRDIATSTKSHWEKDTERVKGKGNIPQPKKKGDK